jgi:hypothetical protein
MRAQLGYLAARVQDSGMVPAAEKFTNLRQGCVCLFAQKVHRHLARIDDRLRAPVAGQLLERDPEALDHRLIEPRRRAVAFLELAVGELGLSNVEILKARVEEVREPTDVVTARAFAPLDRTWAAARPLLRSGGRLVYFAGSGLDDPEGSARALSEPPHEVEVIDPLASGAPLVIMSRG